MKPTSPIETVEDILETTPKSIINLMKLIFENPSQNFSAIRAIRSDLNQQARILESSLEPKPNVIFRLGKIRAALEKSINNMADVDSKELYREASSFYDKMYIRPFKAGTVGNILKKGNGGADRVQSASIAGKFFRPGGPGADAADDFLNAVGDSGEAKRAILDYAKMDLIENATNQSTGILVESKLNKWLSKHRQAIDKFGISEELRPIAKARSALTEAEEMASAFEKGAAAKMLDSDPGLYIQKAFSGGGNMSTKAIEIMRAVSGSKAALKGVKKALVDTIIETAEKTSQDAFGNPVITVAGVETSFKRYSPALKVFFKDDPQKLQALNKVRRAISIAQSTKASPVGGGSDTTELILNRLSQMAPPGRYASLNAVKAMFDVISKDSKTHINAYLNRAIFDPEYAYTLMLAARGSKPEIVKQKLISDFARIGIYVSDSSGVEEK
jgi:hypothetical protein